MDKSSSLGMSMSPQDIFKKYKRQSLGMPKAFPSSSTKISGHVSIHYIFIASYAMCCSWSVFVLFFSLVLFSLLQFLVRSQLFVLERDTLRYHCLEHSSFIPITLRVFSFCQNCLQYSFCSELFSSSLQLGVFNSLIFDEYYPCELFQI